VDAAAGRPGVRPGRIGLVGFSIGAFAAAEVAIGDRRVGALTLEAMQPTLEQELRHDHSAHGVWSELPEVWAMRALGVRVDEVRPAERLCQLAPRPLLLVYGGADPVAPPDLAARLAHSACGPVERWIVRGGGHGGWDETATGQVDARLIAFFEGALAR
jgi:pimeloyl-ACP methyl ester carboxylesterase